MVIGVTSFLAARNGFYPVAIVNFKVITARELNKNYDAAYHYFQNALIFNGRNPQTLEDPKAKLEIHRGALEKLIADELIYSELVRRLRKSDFDSVANNKIDQYLKSISEKDLQTAALNLYGLTRDEFRARVLLPQAYQEVLRGRMELNNENFDQWLNDAKIRASVVILSPNLEWQDGGMTLK